MFAASWAFRVPLPRRAGDDHQHHGGGRQRGLAGELSSLRPLGFDLGGRAGQRQRDPLHATRQVCHVDPPAVQIDDAFHNRQAQPFAAFAGGRCDALAALVVTVK